MDYRLFSVIVWIVFFVGFSIIGTLAFGAVVPGLVVGVIFSSLLVILVVFIERS